MYRSLIVRWNIKIPGIEWREREREREKKRIFKIYISSIFYVQFYMFSDCTYVFYICYNVMELMNIRLQFLRKLYHIQYLCWINNLLSSPSGSKQWEWRWKESHTLAQAYRENERYIQKRKQKRERAKERDKKLFAY